MGCLELLPVKESLPVVWPSKLKAEDVPRYEKRSSTHHEAAEPEPWSPAGKPEVAMSAYCRKKHDGAQRNQCGEVPGRAHLWRDTPESKELCDNTERDQHGDSEGHHCQTLPEEGHDGAP